MTFVVCDSDDILNLVDIASNGRFLRGISFPDLAEVIVTSSLRGDPAVATTLDNVARSVKSRLCVPIEPDDDIHAVAERNRL